MNSGKKIYVIEKFRPMWTSNADLETKYGRKVYKFLNISGRVGGKTINAIQLLAITALDYPDFDNVVLRANSAQLKKSVFLELKKFFFKILPMELFAKIEFRSTPPLSIRMPAGNEILFSGVGLGSRSGSNQSRGNTAERKIKILMFEETQEMFSGTADGRELINQAEATYMRLLDDKDGKVLFLGNRERNINSRFNVWAREKEKDSSFLVIETSYLDLLPFLNSATLRTIEMEKELNPNNYKYMYLGIPSGGNDIVYAAFTETVHVLGKKSTEDLFYVDSRDANKDKYHAENVNQLFIGVDGANSKDKMVFMPIFHFTNARLVVKTGDIISHDPLKNGILTNEKLVKVYVREWLRVLIDRYHLSNKNITFVVDGHCVDLIAQLQYELAPFYNVSVFKFTRKDVVETTKTVNNAFSAGMLYLTDENWHELLSNAEISSYQLFNELQTICWREEEGHEDELNPAIPNDLTDAMRYAVAYHVTPYQLQDFTKAVN